jgi:alpha,alpha-trehalose phosphorylase
MAAIAGSWLALVWGFGGFRFHDGTVNFQPKLPPAWSAYQFSILWRGSQLSVSVETKQVRYELRDGPSLAIYHHETRVELQPGRAVTMAPHA